MTKQGGSVDVSLSEEFSLRELVGVIWRGRWIVLLAVLIMAIAAGAAAMVVTKKYRAVVLISPVAADAAAGKMGSLLSQLGGLGSMVGLSSSVDSKVSEALAVLQSDSLTQAYIKENDLLPVLFHGEWLAQEGRWREKAGSRQPTLWRGSQFFRQRVRTVTTDAKSGLVTLSIDWTDAETAARWANELVRFADKSLRDAAVSDADRNIAYLNSEGRRTEVVEARQAIYSLLQSEINKAMLAKGSEAYALKVIDPAYAPETPRSPNLPLWVLIAAFSGLFLSVLALLMRSAWTDRT
jgi:uncharacterized protein involved in exopolysaccharide biosynthesis